MKKAAFSTIAALIIGFSGTLFAAQTPTQVSPSVINLSADGVTAVTIHTIVDFGECTAQVALKDAASTEFTFPNNELSLWDDSLGNLVIRIETWDAVTDSEDIALGDATFSIVATCDGVTFKGMDDARIIDNAASQKGKKR